MKKKILIYIGHPAQYHFFKNCIHILKKKGDMVKVLIKTKDILEELLKEDGVEYENIQSKPRKNNKFSILLASFERTIAVYKVARQFGADLLIGTDSSIAQAAFLLRRPSITTLEDDVEIIGNLAKLTYPFTSYICVPNVCRVGKWEKKKIGYDGYMKLAYLHPNYFTPDSHCLESYGIKQPFILIRLAKLTAHHDAGIRGLSIKTVKDVIETASKYGCHCYISNEGELDEQLQQYQLRIQPKDIHQIMAQARLLISDSQSMSVEAAMIGIPSLRFSDFAGRISVLEELEHKYSLTYGIPTTASDKLIKQTGDILCNDESQNTYKERHQRMLDDKIDVTAFLVWLINEFPKSIEVVRSEDDYQQPFRKNTK